MPKIVVLGSLSHEPYVVTAPKKKNKRLHAQGPEGHEKAYQLACEWFYPAIDGSDIVLVWLPDGRMGEHTKKDVDYAKKNNKRVVLIMPDKVTEI